MVSMKEIAKQCNVSVATVSKALNGYSDIGEETKNYILRTASEMGYLPNSSARALIWEFYLWTRPEAVSHMITLTEYWKASKAPQRRKAMTLLLQAEMFPVKG